MGRKLILIAALALSVGAAILFIARDWRGSLRGDGGGGRRLKQKSPRSGFVQTQGTRFVIDGRPFRFVGANVAVMYPEDEPARMPETLRAAAANGIRVIRVWANGEGGPRNPVPPASLNDWTRTHSFRLSPAEWNEAAFVQLDHVLAEAARNNLRVQLTLCNWWRDTGGVTQYLRWAGINDAADDRQPFGINLERAMLFYTNAETRRLYREQVEKILTRRNTVTGVLYRDDATILGYELMNEAQSALGREDERRAWMAEMSGYVKSLDPDHLLTTGTWGYRNAWERREWLAEYQLPTVDYCDVHHYPSEDLDLFVDSPETLSSFMDNRIAAACSIGKPLVFDEFGIGHEGYKGISEESWFHSYFETAARDGAGGAMFWIWTTNLQRGFGVNDTAPRDAGVRAEIARASQLFAELQDEDPPERLLDAGHHLVPRQFAFERPQNDELLRPSVSRMEDRKTIRYGFQPEQAASARFEKLGGDAGYMWGVGVGSMEYLVPASEGYRSIGRILVHAHLQPVLPEEAMGRVKASRVSLFINDTDCGSRLIRREDSGQPQVQEWIVSSFLLRVQAARGLPLSIRFVVKADADQPFGLNVSDWPEGYDAHGMSPIEVLVR